MAIHPREIKPTINQRVKGAGVKRGTSLDNICLVNSTVYCTNNHPSEQFIALHTDFPQLASVVVSGAVKPSAGTALKAAPMSGLWMHPAPSLFVKLSLWTWSSPSGFVARFSDSSKCADHFLSLELFSAQMFIFRERELPECHQVLPTGQVQLHKTCSEFSSFSPFSPPFFASLSLFEFLSLSFSCYCALPDLPTAPPKFKRLSFSSHGSISLSELHICKPCSIF